MAETEQQEEQISDEEALMKLAQAMKDSVPNADDKQNVHTFLLNVVKEKETPHIIKIGNLRDDKELNELGRPIWTTRGSLGMALIADKIMGNDYFKEYFEADAAITLGTSLSREGFLIRQSTTTTKSVADVTKRRKINKGMFGKKNVEETGGDPYAPERQSQ
jgi:hypothetical protein